MLDARTLIAVLVMLGLILGLCTLGLRWTLPRSIRGLRPWAAALFGFSASVALAWKVSLGAVGEPWLLLAGAGYVCSALALVLAIRRYCDLVTPWPAALLAYAIALSPTLLASLFDPPRGWAQWWLLPVMLSSALACLHALASSRDARHALGGGLLMLAFALVAISTSARLVLLLRGAAPASWLESLANPRTQWALLLASSALLVGTIGLMLLATERLRRQLEHLASHDALTGLLERNGFRAPAEHSLALAIRRDEPVACLLCDIDHFKQVNDRHGHPAGDAALVAIAAILGRSARASDLIARYGGEEFALLLPNCDEVAALAFGERLRAAVAAQAVDYGGRRIELTVSIGIAVGRGAQLQLEPMYRRADRALYLAKHGGRNAVRLAPAPRSDLALIE